MSPTSFAAIFLANFHSSQSKITEISQFVRVSTYHKSTWIEARTIFISHQTALNLRPSIIGSVLRQPYSPVVCHPVWSIRRFYGPASPEPPLLYAPRLI